MQASVQSEPRRLPRTLSNDSVHISKEISVTSTRAPTPSRSFYSPLPPMHVQRPQTAVESSMPFNNTAVQVARWNSISRSSEKSSVYPRTTLVRRRSSGEHDILESNRESMRALSEFLMNREPPPSNWASYPSSEDERNYNAFKRSAYKILRKNKKKKAKTPQFIQLPDSAVSARTTGGTRHIAISIPLIHDHVDFNLPRPATATGTLAIIPPAQPKEELQRQRSDRNTVQVLKPLHELREPVSKDRVGSSPTNGNGEAVVVGDKIKEPLRHSLSLTPAINSGKNAEKSHVNPLAVHPPDELQQPQSPTLGEHQFGSIMDRPRAFPRTEPSNAPKYDPKRVQKSYVAVSQTAMQRQDSQRTDPRHSGGTAYSTATISMTPQTGHSRQQSSISTAPSRTPSRAVTPANFISTKLDLPPRASSMSKVSKHMQSELASASAKYERGEQDKDALSQTSSQNSSLEHGRSASSPPMIVLGTASTARKYSDGPMLVRSTTPRSGIVSTNTPPPTKNLPDLPEGISKRDSKRNLRPQTAPSLQEEQEAIAGKDARSISRRTSSTREQAEAPRTRQERVKARKQRDIEALRSRAPLADTTTNRDSVPSTTRSTSTNRDSVPRAPNRDSGTSNTTPHSPSTNRDSITSTISSTTSRTSRVITPPTRNPKRIGPSSSERRRLANSVSPIMLVANFPPNASLPLRQHSRSPPLPLRQNSAPLAQSCSFSNSSKKGTSSSGSTIRAIPPRIKILDLDPEKEDEIRKRRSGGAMGKEPQSPPPLSPVTPLPSDFPGVPNHYSTRPILPHASCSCPHMQRMYIEASDSSPSSSASPDSSQVLPQKKSEKDIQAREEEEDADEERPLISTSRRGSRQSLRTSQLATRRAERRTKRNVSLREQELDARLQKIERDNEVLIRTLGGIAGVLAVSKLSPTFTSTPQFSASYGANAGIEGAEGHWYGSTNSRGGRGRGKEMSRGIGSDEKEREMEKERRGELRGLEPFMWELQGEAGRVSGEGMMPRSPRGVS